MPNKTFDSPELLIRVQGRIEKLQSGDTKDNLKKYKVSLIGAGEIPRWYGKLIIPEDVLKRDAHMFNTFAYSHSSGWGQHAPVDRYNTKDKIGSYKNAEFNSKDKLVHADLEVLETTQGKDAIIQLDYALDNKDFQGFSAAFLTTSSYKVYEDTDDVDVTVESFDRVYSVDLVDDPAFPTSVEDSLRIDEFKSEEEYNTFLRKEASMPDAPDVTETTEAPKVETPEVETTTTETPSVEDQLSDRLAGLEQENQRLEARLTFDTLTATLPANVTNKLREKFGDFKDITKEDVESQVKDLRDILSESELRHSLHNMPLVSTDEKDKFVAGLRSHIFSTTEKVGDTEYSEPDLVSFLKRSSGKEFTGSDLFEELRDAYEELPQLAREAKRAGQSFEEYLTGKIGIQTTMPGNLMLPILIEGVSKAFLEDRRIIEARSLVSTISVNPDFNDRREVFAGAWEQYDTVAENTDYPTMTLPDGIVVRKKPNKVGGIFEISEETISNSPANALPTFISGIVDNFVRAERRSIFSIVLSPPTTAYDNQTSDLAGLTPSYVYEHTSKDTQRPLYWLADVATTSRQLNMKREARAAGLNSDAEFMTNDRVTAMIKRMDAMKALTTADKVSDIARAADPYFLVVPYDVRLLASEIVDSDRKIGTNNTWNPVNRVLATENGGGGVITVDIHEDYGEVYNGVEASYTNFMAVVANPATSPTIALFFRYGLAPRFFPAPSQPKAYTRDVLSFRCDHHHSAAPINYRSFVEDAVYTF